MALFGKFSLSLSFLHAKPSNQQTIGSHDSAVQLVLNLFDLSHLM